MSRTGQRTEADVWLPGTLGWGGHRGKTGRGHNRHRGSLGYDNNVLGSGGGDGCAPPRTHRKPQNPSARQTATCVGLLVRLENARGHEATATELALVGLLPGVRPHVLLQVAGLLKAFVAVLTPANTE